MSTHEGLRKFEGFLSKKKVLPYSDQLSTADFSSRSIHSETRRGGADRAPPTISKKLFSNDKDNIEEGEELSLSELDTEDPLPPDLSSNSSIDELKTLQESNSGSCDDVSVNMSMLNLSERINNGGSSKTNVLCYEETATPIKDSKGIKTTGRTSAESEAILEPQEKKEEEEELVVVCSKKDLTTADSEGAVTSIDQMLHTRHCTPSRTPLKNIFITGLVLFIIQHSLPPPHLF